MKLPQLSLRTLFWLLFAAAILTGWVWERRPLVAKIAENQPFSGFFSSARSYPSEASRRRRAMLVNLAKLSNEELKERLPSGPADELMLTEFARRGMVDELQRQFQADADSKSWDDNVAVLTALRRAEGKPDPVRITVKFIDRGWHDEPVQSLRIEGVTQNSDVDRQTFTISTGGDDRGGRHDRWRVELRDKNGQKVPDSNFFSFEGGGIGSGDELKFGESGSWRYVMDPRSYIQRPPSGRYQLQLFHANEDIVHDPDLTGLIVWQSEPIWVEVINREGKLFDTGWPRLAILVLLALVVFAITQTLSRRRTKDSARIARWSGVFNLLACMTIVLLAFGWWYDLRRLRADLARLSPDAEADWTIVAPKS